MTDASPRTQQTMLARSTPNVGWIGLWRHIDETRCSKQARERIRALRRRHAFVSYARADGAVVRQILDSVRDGEDIFWRDELDLTAGGRWSADIVAAIRSSRAVLVFCSAAALNSNDVYREVAMGGRYDKPLIPFLLDDTPLPDSFLYYLSVHQAIRYSDPNWQQRLRDALERLKIKAARKRRSTVKALPLTQ